MSVAALAESQVKEHQEVSCPTGWVRFRRSCGTWQASAVGCRDLLCPDCQRRWAAEARERWFPLIERMREPRMLTLTIPNSFDLAERYDFERASFRRFLDLRMGPRNWPKFRAEADEFFAAHLAEHEPDEGLRAERFDAHLKGLDGLERRIKRFHAERGEWPRVRDVLKCGIANLDVTSSDYTGWHVHRHLVYDGWYVPHGLWRALWLRATKGEAHIVHITYKRPDYDTALELIKYVLKPKELTQEQAQEFRDVFKHAKKVWPIGDAEPSEPEPRACPFCGSLECLVEPWTVEVGSTIYYDGKEARVQLASGVVMLRKVDGVWREWWALHKPAAAERACLNLKHGQVACHSRARDGPKEPSGGFDDSLLEAAFGDRGKRWLSN